MISKKEIGARLRAAREARGMTPSIAARNLGTTNVQVSRWETGANAPSIVYLERVCDMYGISVADLFGKKATSGSVLLTP